MATKTLQIKKRIVCKCKVLALPVTHNVITTNPSKENSRSSITVPTYTIGH
ncbi:hypothetical protein SAMN05421788_1182 [Filimonas lacunae]|uniref:Uncharacterized protein n=1 Tax=Filimonas lacunae TaxID=477680 RepID=A0A1N7RHH3_9BACT|nr:hypothetical protein [Filimonas lacunae]SIT34618.1 hypothetical protein SAMN05421788_1182 [Filimonas lacunae]